MLIIKLILIVMASFIMPFLRQPIVNILENFGIKNTVLNKLNYKQSFFYSLMFYTILFLISDIFNKL
mgnify:CR=1 FL=1